MFGNIQLQTLTTEQCQSFDRVYHGVDWGWYPDPWAYNAVHYDAARRTLVIFDELTRRRTPNRETARLLLDQLADPHARPRELELGWELKCRASTGDENADENIHRHEPDQYFGKCASGLCAEIRRGRRCDSDAAFTYVRGCGSICSRT